MSIILGFVVHDKSVYVSLFQTLDIYVHSTKYLKRNVSFLSVNL